MKILLAQVNPITGNVKYNNDIILNTIKKYNSDVYVFPELITTGYCAEDLFLNKSFVSSTVKKVNDTIQKLPKNKLIIFGSVDYKNENVAIIVNNGNVSYISKTHLPNYNVFDEKRYFTNVPSKNNVVEYQGKKLGIAICEDVWYDDVTDKIAKDGADIIISINASPFIENKPITRFNIVKNTVSRTNIPMIYLNQFGASDSIVFDGYSIVMNSDYSYDVMKGFQEDIRIYEFDKFLDNGKMKDINVEFTLDRLSDIYNALVLGLRDYIEKINMKSVVIGISGGADSTLVAAIASDALGSSNVHGIMMPSMFSADESKDYGIQLMNNLGSNYDIVPIHDLHESWKNNVLGNMKNYSLQKPSARNLADENAQARIRGALILMSYSNIFGNIALTTSNKSEAALGYGTAFGDMAGSFNPIIDVWKTDVFKLMKWRNKNIPEISRNKKLNIIPEEIINRPPSAELSHGQTDEKGLGASYDVLDPILKDLIEHGIDIKELYKKYDKEFINNLFNKIKMAEWKRRLSPLGPKISNISFNFRDRRFPIINQFNGE